MYVCGMTVQDRPHMGHMLAFVSADLIRRSLEYLGYENRLLDLKLPAVVSVVKEINEQGTTILLVEQNARLALKFAKRGYVLENGKLVLEGKADDLLDDPAVKKAYLGA